MGTQPPPEFPYYRNPLETRVIRESMAECFCCGKERGFLYYGNIFWWGGEEPDPQEQERLKNRTCPWCLIEGKARAKWGIHTNSLLAREIMPGIYQNDKGRRINSLVYEAITYLTPAVPSFQQFDWPFCCEDGMTFLGYAGSDELRKRWPEAIAAIVKPNLQPGHSLEEYVDLMDRDGDPSTLVFQCRKCQCFGGTVDRS